MTTTPLAYSKAGAAEAAGVSTKTLERAIKSGELRAKYSGVTDDGEAAGRIIILASALEAWLESRPDA
jgi:hypothetical protein